MAIEVVLDTSYLLAWHRESDRLHSRAKKIQSTLSWVDSTRIVLDCVYSELVSVMAKVRVTEEGKPQEFLREEAKLREIYYGRLVWVAYVGGDDLLRRAIDVCRQSADEYDVGISLHDAMILIFCHERGVPYLISFDMQLGRIRSIGDEDLDLVVVNDRNRHVLREGKG